MATEKLPFSIISGIHLTTFQCWLIMAALVSLIFMLEYRNMKLAWVTATLCGVLIITQVQHLQHKLNEQQFVVYSISNHSAMEWITNGKSYYSADSALLTDYERTRFHILPNRLQHGVKETHTEIPFRQNAKGISLYSWNNTSIAVLDGSQTLPPLPIDYLVVSHQSLSLKDTSYVKPDTKIILDGTNGSRYIARWKQAQQNKAWQVHAVADDGAFIVKKDIP